MMPEADLPQRLAAYLQTLLGKPVPLRAMRRFSSGFSWITWSFTIDPPGIEAETRFILRLGPPDGLFAPYSAAPQYFVLKALEGCQVPVPRAYAWSDDASILGMPFFISQHVDGDTPIPWGGPAMTDEKRHGLGAQFTDALAHLHGVPWHDTGLAPFGKGVTVYNAARLQLDDWMCKYERWALHPYPMIHHALRWLRANLPTAPRVSIVHGDYRLGNFLETDGRITAILDWELMHLGDPVEDIGWLALPQYRAGTKLLSALVAPDEFYQRYENIAGFTVDPRALTYYGVFNLLKLAITHMAGVSAFERNGFSDMRMPAMGTQIFPVLRQLEKALEAA